MHSRARIRAAAFSALSGRGAPPPFCRIGRWLGSALPQQRPGVAMPAFASGACLPLWLSSDADIPGAAGLHRSSIRRVSSASSVERAHEGALRGDDNRRRSGAPHDPPRKAIRHRRAARRARACLDGALHARHARCWCEVFGHRRGGGKAHIDRIFRRLRRRAARLRPALGRVRPPPDRASPSPASISSAA